MTHIATRKRRLAQLMRKVRRRVTARAAPAGSILNREPVSLAGNSAGNSGSSSAEDPAFGLQLPRTLHHSQIERKNRYRLHEFLDHHDSSFIRNAFIGLLGREPEESAWRQNLLALRDGSRSKIEILARIRYSREGRNYGVRVPGLMLPAAAALIYRIPILGYWVRLPISIFRLPRNARAVARLEAYTNSRVADLESAVDRALGVAEAALQQLDQSQSVSRLQSDQHQIELGELQGRLDRASILKMEIEDIVTNESFNDLSRRVEETRLEFVGQDSFEGLVQELADLAGSRVRHDELATTLQGILQDIEETLRDKANHREIAESSKKTQEGIAALREGIRGPIGELEVRSRTQRLSILEMERKYDVLLAETRKQISKNHDQSQLEGVLSDEAHAHDSIYAQFEDRFRGTREEIKERLKEYLPHAAASVADTNGAPLLDLGCGRGEWLEIADGEGWESRGIDTNRIMVQNCADRGFNVEEAEALEFLRAQKSNSFSVITGIHILEHLPFDAMVSLIDESLRVLRRGGSVLFETPNPENLMVGACNFYADPTHRNPIFPPTLEFTLKERGFESVELVRPARGQIFEAFEPLAASDPMAAHLNPIRAVLNQGFSAPPDFAAIGRKV